MQQTNSYSEIVAPDHESDTLSVMVKVEVELELEFEPDSHYSLGYGSNVLNKDHKDYEVIAENLVDRIKYGKIDFVVIKKLRNKL